VFTLQKYSLVCYLCASLPRLSFSRFYCLPDAQQEEKRFKRVPKVTPIEVSSCSNRSLFRKQYTPLQMISALNAVLENGVSANMAAAMHEVPPSTLKDRLSGRV